MSDKPVEMGASQCPQCGHEQDAMAIGWADGEQSERFDYACERCGVPLTVTVFMVPLFQVELRDPAEPSAPPIQHLPEVADASAFEPPPALP
jgi:hypothetical protein